MPKLDRIRVGLIGYGIGKLHAAALRSASLYYPQLPPIELVAVATSSVASGKLAIKNSGFERATPDYRHVLASKDINTVVIATPNYLHHEMIMAALETDKALYIDKPLANSLAEAREIVELAEQHGRGAQLAFVLRYSPAMHYARQLIQQGRLGEIYAFRSTYFRSSYIDPEKPLRWKASMATSGGGVLNDLVPHQVDLILWLIGMPEKLTAQTRTFIKERPAAKNNPTRVPVETDDHVIIQAAMPGGAIGTIESGRLVTGSINDLTIEINGSEGALRWNSMDANYLYIVDRRMPEEERGWLQIPTVQRYPDAVIPGADVSVGATRYYIASIADFLKHMLADEPYDPGLEDGLRVQAVVEAALKATHKEKWISVEQR